MSELKVYEVEVNGFAATMQLTATDAALRGLSVEDTVEHRVAVRAWLAAESEYRVAVGAWLDAEQAEAERVAAVQVVDAEAAKQRAAANKSRTAANKGA